MAGEFIATWAYEATHEDAPCPNVARETETSESESVSSDEDAPETSEMDGAEILEAVRQVCPETDDLPDPGKVPMDKASRAAMERDGYQCCFPGCSARAKLHPPVHVCFGPF